MQLILRHPAIQERRIEVDERGRVFGRRGGAADVDMSWDPRVSRRHARFWVEAGQLWFQDLDSTNGTWLHGQRARGPAPLDSDTTVVVGETVVLAGHGEMLSDDSFDAQLASLLSMAGEATESYLIPDLLAREGHARPPPAARPARAVAPESRLEAAAAPASEPPPATPARSAPALTPEDVQLDIPLESFAAFAASTSGDLPGPEVAPPSSSPGARAQGSSAAPNLADTTPRPSISGAGLIIEEPAELSPPAPSISATGFTIEEPDLAPSISEPGADDLRPRPRSGSSRPLEPPYRHGATFAGLGQVTMALPDREAFRKVYTSELSRGGLFVESGKPPPRGSRVTVRISTPDGVVELPAEVVHAATDGPQRGAGLAFMELSAELRTLLTRYAEGTAFRLELGSASSPAVAAPAVMVEAALLLAKELIAKVEKNDLYGALGIDPKSTSPEISTKLNELRHALNTGQAQGTPPQRARFASALKLLDKIGPLLLDAKRRLEFDFRVGEVRVAERLAAARNKTGPSAGELRDTWSRVHPDRTAAAVERTQKALEARRNRDLARAIELGHESLELDPFQDELRQNMAAWEWMASKQ